MTRLTDDELANIASEESGSQWDRSDCSSHAVTAVVAELRERRAADLKPEEVEDLKQLQWAAKTFLLGGDRYDPSEYERRCKIVRALPVLDRLLGKERR